MSADLDCVIAVVGMGLVLPGANSPQEYWQVLEQDEVQFGPPDARWDLETLYSPDRSAQDRVYRREMGYVTRFQPHPGTDRDASPLLDSEAGRWLRHCLLQATSGVRARSARRWLLSVAASPDASQRLEEALIIDGAAALLASDSREAGRIRDELRAYYPGADAEAACYLPPEQVALAAAGIVPEDCQISVLQAACSGSLQSVDAGVRALVSGECDIAVCGSSFVLNRLTNVLCCVMRAAAVGEGVRPFDKRAEGTVFGEGAGLIALKRNREAVADGDQVLGLILGAGASVDGPGTSIVTPNPTGQRLAVERALERAGLRPQHLQWVIAHGTGTRAGDAAELRMLTDLCTGAARWQVTSNKALIGHTGWTAGVASIIHALLALQHDRIPAQRHFDEAADPSLAQDGALTIPLQDVEWSKHAEGAARVAAVCAYGLGGVNGCVLVADRAPESAVSARGAAPEDVVVTAWHAHLPGSPARAAVEAWLKDGSHQWQDTFPDPYPVLAPEICGLPPGVQGSMDRAQLAILECAHGLVREISSAWRPLGPDTGVFVGHMGPTQGCCEYAVRAGIEDLSRRVGAGRLPGSRGLTAAQLTDLVREAVPRAISDTYTGLIGCIMASRVCVQHDLRGLALVHEAGPDSSLAALNAARLQLASGGVQFALVFAVAANAARGDALLGHARGQPLREGVFALALSRRSTAERIGLPVLAVLGRGGLGVDAQEETPPALGGFLGADSAVRVLRALVGAAPMTSVRARQDRHTPTVVLSRPDRRPERQLLTAPGRRSGTLSVGGAQSSIPGRARQLVHLEGDLLALLGQHMVDRRPTMPGTVMLELAAQAAAHILPQFLPQSFHEAQFASFVRAAAPGRDPVVLKLDAIVLERTAVDATVQVSLASDVVLPGGLVLQPDRRHMSVRVRMASYLPQRPFWDSSPPPADAPAVPDVYRAAGALDGLSGVFDCLRDLRLHGRGGSANWTPRAEPCHPLLSNFRTPAVLLDGLLRTCQLRGDRAAPHPCVPVAIESLNLYTMANDIALAGLFGSGIALHHLPQDPNSAQDRRQLALAPDGTILADVRGLRVLSRPPLEAVRSGT